MFRVYFLKFQKIVDVVYILDYGDWRFHGSTKGDVIPPSLVDFRSIKS